MKTVKSLLAPMLVAAVGCGSSLSEQTLSSGAASASAPEARTVPVTNALTQDPPLPADLSRDGGWAGLQPPAPPTGGAHASYTCPMHPDVVSEREGKCPRCGMTLVPKK